VSPVRGMIARLTDILINAWNIISAVIQVASNIENLSGALLLFLTPYRQ